MHVGLNGQDDPGFAEGDRQDDNEEDDEDDEGVLVDIEADSEEQAEEDALLAQDEEEEVPNDQEEEEEANLRDLLCKNGDEDNSTGDLVPPQGEPGVEQLQDERMHKEKKNESAGIKRRENRLTGHRAKDLRGLLLDSAR